MKVIKSKILGYCHGVSATLQKAEFCIKKAEENNKPCYCIGKLIHNKDVVTEFENKGLEVIYKPNQKAGIALIRAHGIADNVRYEFEYNGFELVDATCINIIHSREKIKQAYAEGRKVVVLGVKNHAETNCLMGIDNVDCFLVSEKEDLDRLFSVFSKDVAVTVITQTTFMQNEFVEYTEKMLRYFTDCIIGNDLCKECIRRKENAVELAQICDVIVVVGGFDSENTKDLARYLGKTGKPIFFVENSSGITDAMKSELRKYDCVGVCSGTSTPLNIIDRVCECLETIPANCGLYAN